jgi:tetratricopeptide (TPR) repeat protein
MMVEPAGGAAAAGYFPMAERWMAQAVCAASVGLALAAAWLVPAGRQRVALGVFAVWTALAVLSAQASHRPYRSEIAYLDLLDARYEAVPEDDRTERDLCRWHERQLARPLARGELPQALAAADAWPHDACDISRERQFDLLALYVETERYADAARTGTRLLREQIDSKPVLARTHFLTGRGFLGVGDADQAMAHFDGAELSGLRDCDLDARFAAAAELSQDWQTAAQRLERFDECERAAGRSTSPKVLLNAARFWMAAGVGDEARRVSAELRRRHPTDTRLGAQLDDIAMIPEGDAPPFGD